MHVCMCIIELLHADIDDGFDIDDDEFYAMLGVVTTTKAIHTCIYIFALPYISYQPQPSHSSDQDDLAEAKSRSVNTGFKPYIHTFIHTHTYIFIHAYITLYIHTYIHIYIYTHMHTFIYAYIHTYIHTYKYK